MDRRIDIATDSNFRPTKKSLKTDPEHCPHYRGGHCVAWRKMQGGPAKYTCKYEGTHYMDCAAYQADGRSKID